MEENTEKNITAGADKDLMYVVKNLSQEDVGKMLGMVADSQYAMEMILRRVHELKDNSRISDGQYQAFSKKLHDIARARGTILPGQQIIATPISKKKTPDESHGT